ncbi:MarR family winged helix-turn-helix transcriptional regulator [Paenibacillus sp. UNC451MF]|uniref:MarR family winged helix-turn-helix transcriptional regulator n=1 Tax=Paenibacillus sp. UNC451MF TaxID=1449063 RepID=UPI000490D703|nr:MarR family winged helix-turn-helix transcriptional regulator [Paenibacillus sp. UNC451MF]
MDKHAFFQKFVAFSAAVHQTTHEMTKDVKADDITPVQYNILEYIAISQPVTPSQVSDCQHMSMPNTSRELKKLCEKNLCEKFDAPDDRRKQYYRLNPEGEHMMSEAFKLIEARFLQRLRDASKEDLEEIEYALDVLSTKVFYSDKP